MKYATNRRNPCRVRKQSKRPHLSPRGIDMNSKRAKMLRRAAERLTVGMNEDKTRKVYESLKKAYKSN